MENLYLIVGLGNPGTQYRRTRHNVGFVVLDSLAERWRVSWSAEKKFNASLARTEREGRRVLLCKPQTFMNASGQAIKAVAAFYDLMPAGILIVLDDADLPLGHLRLRPGGSSGGHHGLESIEQHLGTRDYPRLRVGIGRREGAREITGHVLGRFDSTESVLADKVLARAAEPAEAWLVAGIQKAMTRFNGVIVDAANEREDQ
jgi:peptidyl-tRNA hydrolase, PTH1 family